MGFQLSTIDEKEEEREPVDLSTDVLINCGATFSAGNNKQMVRNIRPAKTPIRMSTNTGKRRILEECDVDGFKKTMWFDPQSKATILSFADLSDQCHITYDNKKDDAFYVGNNGNYRQFPRTKKGLYALRVHGQLSLAPLENKKGQIHLETVEENMIGFTDDEIKRLKKQGNYTIYLWSTNS